MATSPSANPTPITPPRVPLIDPRTGLIDRAWYQFFLSLFRAANTALDDQDLSPSAESLSASLEAAIDRLTQELQTQPVSVVEQVQPLLDALAQKLDTLPSPQTAELQTRVAAVEQELQTLPRPALGSMAALQQDNVPWLTFNTAPSPVPTAVGSMYWDGGTTMGVQATTDVLIRVGESEYVYAKASSAITKGQLCYHTGAVGSSGVITVAPTPLALTDPNQIVGVAAETIALNGFGLIQISGDLRGFNTTGTSVGEVWADGDPLYYNPAYVGSFTKTKPTAPSIKSYIGEVTNAGSGGSGSIHIRIVPGSVLGGTDSNVQFGTLNNGDLIQYDSALQYWKNVAASSVSVSTATNLAGGATGSVPYQSAASTTTFLPIGTAAQVMKVNAGATAPEWASGAALTKVDDTNVTLTLGGTPATSLLAATSLTLGWTGQLGLTRGGTNASLTASAGSVAYSTATALALNIAGNSGDWLKSAGTSAPAWTAPAALTKTDDTNVTVTLGGSASTALLNAASLTLGWTGQLAVSRGGTGASTFTANGIVYGNTTSALQVTAAGTTGQVLVGNTGSAPSWSAASTLSVDTAANLLSNSTTGKLQITGPAAASTRVMTTPDANFTVARTDAAQTFTGIQTLGAAVKAGTYSAGATTPSVAGISFLNIANSSATSITNFTGGTEGQILVLWFADSNTTITRNNAYLSGGVNFTSTASDTLTLLYSSPYWFEVARSLNA